MQIANENGQPYVHPIQTPTPTLPPMPLKIRGSIPYWDQEKAVSSFRNNVASFDEIALFWYYLGSDGTIKKYRFAVEDASLIEFARNNSVKVFAVITNLPETDTWDSDRVENMLQTKENRLTHIKDIIVLLDKHKFDGVSIDYEEVTSTQKEAFSLFIEELRGQLSAKRKSLGVALHPKTGSKNDERYGFQDWRRLSQSADQLYIMAYGEHYDEGQAGPIASIPWLKRILAYGHSQQIDKQKFFLGIPLYGYDWNKDNNDAATGLTYQDVTRLITRFQPAVQFEEEAKTPFFLYKSSGQNHEVWFEDTQSILAKVRLAKQEGLGGVTFWRLGGDDQSIWPLVTNLVAM